MIDLDQHLSFAEEPEPKPLPTWLDDLHDYTPRTPLLVPLLDKALIDMTVDELLDSCARTRNDLDAVVDRSQGLRGE